MNTTLINAWYLSYYAISIKNSNIFNRYQFSELEDLGRPRKRFNEYLDDNDVMSDDAEENFLFPNDAIEEDVGDVEEDYDGGLLLEELMTEAEQEEEEEGQNGDGESWDRLQELEEMEEMAKLKREIGEYLHDSYASFLKNNLQK